MSCCHKYSRPNDRPNTRARFFNIDISINTFSKTLSQSYAMSHISNTSILSALNNVWNSFVGWLTWGKFECLWPPSYIYWYLFVSGVWKLPEHNALAWLQQSTLSCCLHTGRLLAPTPPACLSGFWLSGYLAIWSLAVWLSDHWCQLSTGFGG